MHKRCVVFSFVTGILAEKASESPRGAYFVVDAHGVGFEVRSSMRSVQSAPAIGESVRLFTLLLVREDALTLVGFLTREERDLFSILQSASGVGAKVGLSLLSTLSVPEIAHAIVAGQHTPLTKAKGVGAKLAQKMVLELKEKMTQWRSNAIDAALLPEGSPPASEAFHEAESVLLSLGYQSDEIARAFRAIPTASTTSSEAILHDTLRWLAQSV
jgi:holliday junction DNA helicase RuvA